MESNNKKRALDVGVTLGLMATFVAASLALSPTAPPVGPGDSPTESGDQLAFDDADRTSSTSGPIPDSAPAPNAGQTTTTEANGAAIPQDSSLVETPADTPEPATGSDNSTADNSRPPAGDLPPIGAGQTPTVGRSASGWAYDWGSDPGVRLQITDHQPQNTVDAAGFGVVANDDKDDHAGITAALASLGTQGGRVVLPAGTLHTSDTVNLSSGQVLRGAGTNDTTIVFTANLTHGIELGGGYPSDAGVVVSGSADGLTLVVKSSSPATPGQLAVVRGGSAVSAEAGQIVSIRTVEPQGSNWLVTLTDPAAQDLSGASFRTFEPGRKIGLENMNLVPAANANVDYHVVLRATEDSWVTNVRSEWATRSHLYTRQSYRCEIRDNTFTEATNKGDGGHGYGLNIANNTTGCLFMQNRLARLRHSILLHGGATANVVAYNTSTEPRHPNFVNGGPADMSFHGYSVSNLVEGNILERTQLTDAGSAGPDNAIVRNCFTSGPITLKNSPHRTVIIGNSILGSNSALQNTTMPAVEWSDARPYTTSDLFDADGILIQGNAPDLTITGNWYNGATDGPSVRSAFAAADLTPETPTGTAATDCPYAR